MLKHFNVFIHDMFLRLKAFFNVYDVYNLKNVGKWHTHIIIMKQQIKMTINITAAQE